MDKSVLFLLFLTTIPVKSHWNTIGKCCAKNEMLISSDSGDVNCTSIKNSEVEGLFYFGPQKPYLRACPENVTKIEIRNDFPSAFQRVHCIDVLELEGPHRHVLTGLQLDRKCAKKYRFISSFVSDVKKNSEPLYLCCKANEKFDITMRKCVPINVEYQRKKLGDVVQSLRGRSVFLTVYDGGILCPDVMVDYFVRPSDFFLGPNGIPKVSNKKLITKSIFGYKLCQRYENQTQNYKKNVKQNKKGVIQNFQLFKTSFKLAKNDFQCNIILEHECGCLHKMKDFYDKDFD